MIQTDELISLHELALAQVEDDRASFHRIIPDTISEHEVRDFLRRMQPLYKTKNKYLLTSQAAKMCTIMANKDPDLIIRSIDQATANLYSSPIWIEWDRMDQLGRQPDEAEDKIAGFLAWKEFSTGEAVNLVHWGSSDLQGCGCSLVGMSLWPKTGIEWKGQLGNNEENVAIDRLDTERARLLGWNWIADQAKQGADINALVKRVSWGVGSLTGFSFGRVVAKRYRARMDTVSVEDTLRGAMDASADDMRMAATALALKHQGILIEKAPKPIPQHHEKAGRIKNLNFTLLDVRKVHEDANY